MKILVIEDNPIKREKVCGFLRENLSVKVVEAASYNGGLRAFAADSFDLLVLDLSMPTFDRTAETHGGRFRALAGMEIATRITRQGSVTPIVVLTGYKDFSVNSQSLNVQQIDETLKQLGKHYLGCIFFDAAESFWSERLGEIVLELSE